MGYNLRVLFYFSIVLLLVFLDQWTKIYIKTNFYLGQELIIIPNIFKLWFTENPGAAFGTEIGGVWGKYLLSTFRLLFSGFFVYYLYFNIRENNKFYIWACLLLLSGAIGNSIDGLLYGAIFSESNPFTQNVAHFTPFLKGYAPLLQGKVVDMLSFPIIDTILPEWVPYWGGQRFTFFDPIFNLADSFISIAFVLFLLAMMFPQKKS
ncbi:MAG: lipoprotein signal peptidase [Chitinophagales bacterium]|jgi:signal peptidase II|nr:lipoprotein signal peptidase [Chitinophagales bacterium]